MSIYLELGQCHGTALWLQLEREGKWFRYIQIQA
jgi:hypothetical protein